MHVFTYGTLMFPEVWRAVVGRDFATVDGTAQGFAIYRVCDAVFPGIIAAGRGDSVLGVVYRDVDERSLERLDRFEDDFYERQIISIDCPDGERCQASAYVVPPQNRGVLTTEPWLREKFVVSGGLQQFIERFAGFSRLSGGDSGLPKAT